MRSLSECRKLAKELKDFDVVPPYFSIVNLSEISELEQSTGFFPASDYPPGVANTLAGYYDVGAREEFRFVIRDRREGPRDRRRKL
jgi:hypothetical protein